MPSGAVAVTAVPPGVLPGGRSVVAYPCGGESRRADLTAGTWRWVLLSPGAGFAVREAAFAVSRACVLRHSTRSGRTVA